MRLPLALLMLLAAVPVLAAPVITWVSDPVRPDETVVLLSEGCSENAVVEMARVEDALWGTPMANAPAVPKWISVKPLQASRQCVKAVVPPAFKAGVFALRLREGGEFSQIAYANAPEVWWAQGDEGQRCTPGGWLRAFGRCLGFGGKVQAVLRDAKGADVALSVRQADLWSVSAAVPTTMAPGAYELWVHNGFGGASLWREAGKVDVIAPVAWKTDVFEVKDVGEGAEGDEAIRKVLAVAKENGGGVVLLGRGTYDILGPLEVPPGTTLRGEGPGLVSLYFKNSAEPPDAFISGSNYALEDLSLYCYNYIKVVRDSSDSERFRMKNVIIRAVPDATRHNIIKPVKPPLAALHLLGRNYQVTGCDIYAATPGNLPGRSIVTGPWGFSGQKGPWYGLIADNIIDGHMYGCENLRAVIYERNKVKGVSLGATTYWNNFADTTYFANNYVQHVYGGDREIMTFDAGGGAYEGKATAIGTRLLLAADPVFHDYAPKPHTDYRGAAVYILNGTGAGQWRYVTANNGREWEVERPWDAAPDETSLFSIVPFRGRNLFVNNTFVDGGAMQLYGSAADVIVAGNKGARIDGFFTWGLNPHGWGNQPAFTAQFLDNEITEGSGYGGRVWGRCFFGVITSNDKTYAGPMARGNILRRNLLHTDSWFNISGTAADTLVEDCVVKHVPIGIKVGKDVTGVVLRRNVFEDVETPVGGEGAEKAFVSPTAGK
ncbi:MAG: hypothetical protein ACYC63_19355 [Armatimonadota bacterium]